MMKKYLLISALFLPVFCTYSGGITVDHAKAEITQKEKNTKLIQAIQNNNIPLAEELLRNGADANARHGDAKVPVLRFATRNNNAGAINLLLRYRADIDARCQHGNTALISAANGSKVLSALTLLENGADVNRKNSMGNTPLMMAAYTGNKELGIQLLQHGANLHQIGSETVLTSAIKSLEIALSRRNREHIADARDILSYLIGPVATKAQATKNGAIRTHEATHVDVNQRTLPGLTPLYVAAAINVPEVVITLIDRGADANCLCRRQDIVSAEYLTPLMIAVINGNEIVVRELLRAGASPTIKNNFHKIALDFAKELQPSMTKQRIIEALNYGTYVWSTKSEFNRRATS